MNLKVRYERLIVHLVVVVLIVPFQSRSGYYCCEHGNALFREELGVESFQDLSGKMC